MDPITVENRKKITTERQFRELRTDRAAVDSENRTVSMAFASEVPYMRWMGYEILGCRPGEVRMDRMLDKAPLLLQHDPDDQIGVVESASLDSDAIARATVRFSKSEDAERIFQDVLDEIRTKVSVGYIVHDVRDLKPEEMSPELQQMCLENKCGAYRVIDWEPLEVSIVSVPADNGVGVGRALTDQPSIVPAAEQPAAAPALDSPKPQPQTKRSIAMNQEELAKLEAERKAAIEDLAKRFGSRIKGGEKAMAELEKAAVETGVPAELFRGQVFTMIVDGMPVEKSPADLDLSEKDAKRYSVARAILSLVPGSGEDAAFEREVSNTIRKRLEDQGFRIEGNRPTGILVPVDVQKRTLSATGGATVGGNVVATNLLSGDFIELLRNRLLATQLGVQVLSGLVGNVAIPKQSSSSTAYWLTPEGTAATDSQLALGQVTMTPKTVGARTDFTRQLLKQSTPSIDMLVQNDLIRVLATAIDLAIFEGTGASGQPSGISIASGIGSVAGASFDRSKALENVKNVMTANADVATMSFVTNPTVWQTLKNKAIASNYPAFLIDELDKMVGYPVKVTNQISAGTMLFGDFSQAILGSWGVLDLTIDPYSLSSTGNIRVVAFQSVDVGVRQAGAFSKTTGIS